MTRRQRPAPSAPPDRQLPMVVNVPPGRGTGTQKAYDAPQLEAMQFTMLQETEPQRPQMLPAAQTQGEQSDFVLQQLTPKYAAEARAIASEVPHHDGLPVDRGNCDGAGSSPAKEADVTALKHESQGVQNPPLGQTRTTPVDPNLPAGGSAASNVPASVLKDLENRVRVTERHLHAEKTLTKALEEALMDLENQSNKDRADRETWNKKALQLEEELQGLRTERSLSGGVNYITQQPDCHSTPSLLTELRQNRMEMDGANPQGGSYVAARVCDICRQRQAWFGGELPAWLSCEANKRLCSNEDAPLPDQDTHISPAWSTSRSGKAHTHIVPAAHGYAFEVKAGDRFRVVDMHGLQVVDFMAWCHPYKHSKEYLSMSYTRHAIGGSAPPQVGECLYTNKDEPIFKLVADTVKTHDMLYMACNPGFYKRLGKEGHRSCATNIAEAMKGFGMESWMEVTDPFNIFQNTPYYSLKALNSSRAGDYVEFEALKDAVCAVSSCPFDGDGFNGGKVTEVAVVTGI